jgi:alkylglycerol monooxygenase
LIFSLSGDIWLIWGARYFLFGLAAFLCAHIAYLIAFTRSVKFPARPIVWLLYLAIGAALYMILSPKLFAALKLPVALYTFFLASMAAQAMGRFLTLRTPFARLAAIGAAFFLLSDTLLAINEFYTPLPFSVLSVLGSYYLAQWLIASSTFQEWGKPIQSTSPWFSSQ